MYIYHHHPSTLFWNFSGIAQYLKEAGSASHVCLQPTYQYQTQVPSLNQPRCTLHSHYLSLLESKPHLGGSGRMKECLNSLLQIQFIQLAAHTAQAQKFGRNDRFITLSFPSLRKGGNDNSFSQLHLHNTTAFFEDLTGKRLYNLAYKIHFLHIDLQRCTNEHVFPKFNYLFIY